MSDLFFNRRKFGFLCGAGTLSSVSFAACTTPEKTGDAHALPTHAAPSTSPDHHKHHKHHKHPQDSPLGAVGKHIIFSYSGTQAPQELYHRIADSAVGGVIFFSENIGNTTSFIDTVASLHHAALNSKDKRPILLLTDEEGGMVDRLSGGGSSARTVGAAANPAAQAQAQARLHANLFHRYHLNANLGPVLGVYRSSNDFLDSAQRSFSQEPQIVAQCGASYIKEFQKHGVIATAKHFPGLGAASRSANTDATTATLNISEETLRSTDLVPFIHAIRAGVKAIMPSWATYPAIDPHHVAGMSPIFINRILRKQLGFSGVTITDAIEAGALAQYGSTAHRAVTAINAGNDLLCCSNRSIQQGISAADALEKAARSGQIAQPTLHRSAHRIDHLHH